MAASGSAFTTAREIRSRIRDQVWPAHLPAISASACPACSSDSTAVSSAISRAFEAFKIPASSAAAVSGSRVSSTTARPARVSAACVVTASSQAISAARSLRHTVGVPPGSRTAAHAAGRRRTSSRAAASLRA